MAENINNILTVIEGVRLALRSGRMRKKDLLHNVYYILGSPGIGKTSIFEYECLKRNWGFIPVSPALETREKFGGIPDILWRNSNGEIITGSTAKPYSGDQLITFWSIPDLIDRANRMSLEKEQVFILLDDFHLCDEELQSIAFELFTYWSLRGYKFNKNVSLVLAGNETSAAGAQTMLTAVMNRATPIHVKSDVIYWLNNFAIPNGIHQSAISFFGNSANFRYFHEKESSEPFGSARSWTSLFNNISDLEEDPYFEDKTNPELKAEFIKYVSAIAYGSVSKEAAGEFNRYFIFLKDQDFNTPLETGEFEIPTDPIKRYGYAIGITHEFMKKYYDKKEREKLMKMFGIFLKKMTYDHRDLTISSLIYLRNSPANPDYHIVSGKEIYLNLDEHEFISKDIVRRILDSKGNLEKI